MSKNKIIACGDNSQAAGRDINNFNINPDSTFIFNPQDLADIIDVIFSSIDIEETPIYDFNIINIEEKNQKNNITTEFYEECIKEAVGYFSNIDNFLKNPNNKDYKDKFFGIVNILKPKVINAIQTGQDMQNILCHLFDYFYETNQVCSNDKKPLIMVLAYYMYHNCYIGRK